MSEEESNLEAEEIIEDGESSWTSYVAKVMILVKTIVILTILIRNFLAWYRLKDDIKSQALAVRKLVLIQSATCMVLLIAAAIFEFVSHYTHYYLTLFILASYVFYGTLYVVLRIGAQELHDVEWLLKKIKIVLIVFISLTAMIFLVGWFKHDYNAYCFPHSYPRVIIWAKGLNAAWNIFSITLYLVTIKCKSTTRKEELDKESDEKKAFRKVYEQMFATYNCWCIVLMIARFISTMLGEIFMVNKGWIVCSEDGLRWIILDDSGSIFLTVHVALLLLICVMTKTLFGKTAMQAGLIPDKKKLEQEKKETKRKESFARAAFAEPGRGSQPEQEVDLVEENKSAQEENISAQI